MNRSFVLGLAALALVACGGGEAATSKPAQDTTQSGLLTKDIVDTANGAGQFKTLLAAVKADIQASNGVIHVIDAVVLPQ